jgi:hypothetical protein
MSKNECAKTRSAEDPYEIWSSGTGWEWHVLKKYQAEEGEKSNQYARWFCLVKSPFVPEGEMGDVYVSEIQSVAIRIK